MSTGKMKTFRVWLISLADKFYNKNLIFLIPSLIMLIRGWQYILHPQLYAEDGALWLADAYNEGFKSIFQWYSTSNQYKILH